MTTRHRGESMVEREHGQTRGHSCVDLDISRTVCISESGVDRADHGDVEEGCDTLRDDSSPELQSSEKMNKCLCSALYDYGYFMAEKSTD